MAPMRPRRISKRFVTTPRQVGQAASSESLKREVFAEGCWPSIRGLLEARGWSPSHVEQIHEQLRQGWPLTMAVRHVALRMGTCPLRSRFLG